MAAVTKAGVVLRRLSYPLIVVALVLSHRNLPVVVVLIALTGLAALWREWSAPPRWSWPLLALAGYLALSTIWSPSTDDRDWALRLPAVVLLVFATVAAARLPDRMELVGFGAAVTIAAMLASLEAQGLSGFRAMFPPDLPEGRDAVASARGLGLAVVLMPVGLVAVGHARRAVLVAPALMIAVLVGIAAFGSEVSANGLAFGAAMVLAPVGWLMGGRGAGLAFALLAAGFILWPPIALSLPDIAAAEAMAEGPVSWRHRLLIWRTVADAATGDGWSFLFGAGQHASSVLTETAGQVSLPGSPIPLARVPSHPHNVFLQVWYEAGAVGSALAASGVAMAARRLWSAPLPRGVAAALAATVGTALVFLSVGANLWTLWRLAAYALAAFGLLAAANVVHEKTTR